ncbi:MAG: resA protein [Pseudomonadota bacterium]|jgi:peroxiredoxin
MRFLFLALSLLGSVPYAHAGSPAPGFTLRDLSNRPHTLEQYRGKVVLLDFWATFCGPCLIEMPHLQKMYTDLAPKGLVVLGISADAARDQSRIKPLVAGKGLTYPILLDPQTTTVAAYNPSKTLPYSVVVGRDGSIVHVHAGYNPGDEVALRAAVEAALAAP